MSGTFLKRALQLVVVLGGFTVATAFAANIAVISNSYFDAMAADYNTRYPAHTFTGIDATDALTLDDLAAYDAAVLFEDGIFAEAPDIGDVLAAFANTGRAVVLGTFYNQDRSDTTAASFTPHGWGDLEDLDPNVSDTWGTSYDGDTLDAGSILTHPLTNGVSTLWSGDSGYSGGNQAKDGSVVLALWSNPNYLGNPDPAIAYRVTGDACVIHIGIIPHYDHIGTVGVDFGGDFFQVWSNAMDYAASGCDGIVSIDSVSTPPVPTVNTWAIILLTLTLAGMGILTLRRLR